MYITVCDPGTHVIKLEFITTTQCVQNVRIIDLVHTVDDTICPSYKKLSWDQSQVSLCHSMS